MTFHEDLAGKADQAQEQIACAETALADGDTTAAGEFMTTAATILTELSEALRA